MTRKRKVLVAVNGNALSKPPMRRIASDVEFSMESWEQKVHTDSKTPKISNCGGSATKPTNPSAKKHRVTHRRPPRPTRPAQGGLGSTILEPSGKTPKRDRRGGISFRPSPKPSLSDRFTQATSRLNPKPGLSPPAVPLKRGVVQSSAEGQEEALAKIVGSLPSQGTKQGALRSATDKIPLMKQGASRAAMDKISLTVKPKKIQFSSTGIDSVKTRDEQNGPGGSHTGDNATGTRYQSDTTKNHDDDMNCDSSEDSLLNSSSESSPDVSAMKTSKTNDARGREGTQSGADFEINPGQGREKKHTTDRDNIEMPHGRVPSETSVTGREERLRPSSFNQPVGRTEGGNLHSNVTMRRNAAPVKPKQASRLLGATIGTHRFSLENLEEDTDVTDMTTLSGEDTNSTNTSFEEDNETDLDDDASNGVRSPFHARYTREAARPPSETDDEEKIADETNAARRLDLDIPSPASVERASTDSSGSESLGGQSYEGWSIDGYTNSPILLTIEKKTYVHPPLPAGWRIKVSKTHKRPIYIHPDIGRTFHCPVDLPQNVIYVKTRDGKLEKRFQGDNNTDPESPETSPSNHQDSNPSRSEEGTSSARSSLASAEYTSGSQSSKSSLDSTAKLIVGATEHSADVLHHSSLNFRNAVALVKNKQQTPSTMSDIVRYYERDKPFVPQFDKARDVRDKDGYQCDVSDSEVSIESSSSLSSFASVSKVSLRHGLRVEALEKTLSPVTELGKSERDDDLRPNAPLETPTAGTLFQGVVGEEQHLRQWSTPGFYSESNYNQEQPAVPDYEMWKQGIGMDTSMGGVHGEYNFTAQDRNAGNGETIEAWFTPDVGPTTSVTTTVRHNAKRSTAEKDTVQKDPETVLELNNRKDLNETTQDSFSSIEKKSLALSAIENEDHIQNKMVEVDNGTKNSTDHGNLLPFFDIFEQHLEQTGKGTTPRHAEDYGRHDAAQQSYGEEAFLTPALNADATAPNSREHDFTGQDNTMAKDKALAGTKTQADAELGAPLSQEEGTAHRSSGSIPNQAHNINSDGSVFKTVSTPLSPLKEVVVRHSGRSQRKDYERMPLEGEHESFQKTSSPQTVSGTRQGKETEKSMGTSAVANHPRSGNSNNDSTVETANNEVSQTIDSPPSFDDLPDADTPESDVPATRQETSLSDLEIELKDSKRQEKVSTISQEDQNGFSDDEESMDSFPQPDNSSENDDNDIEGIEVDLENSPSSFYVSVKRRRMSWRVLNPTYPLCSLQRLDEIAAQAKQKRGHSATNRKKRKTAKKGTRKTKSKSKTAHKRSRE